MALIWKLKQVMFEREIGTVDLADWVGVDPSRISQMKKSVFMPERMNPGKLNQYLEALRVLGQEAIAISDLVEYKEDCDV